MEYSINERCIKVLNEPVFELFRHEGFICCVQRMNWSGNLNGYVGVEENNSLFGKDYSAKVVVKDVAEIPFNGNYIGLLISSLEPQTEIRVMSIDMALNVHGGITFSSSVLCGIEDDLFGNLWWFGFDTAHSGDLKPIMTDIDKKYNFENSDNEYRDFDYVKDQTKKLAEQLKEYNV